MLPRTRLIAASDTPFVRPSVISALPIMPLKILNPGIVKCTRRAEAAFLDVNGAYVNGAATLYAGGSGNDSTGDGTKNNPYRTLKKVLADVEGSTFIRLLAGDYDVTTFNLTYTSNSQANGTTAKHVSVDPDTDPKDVRLYCPGPEAATQTFTLTANGGGVYKTTLTGTTRPFKLTRLDGVDSYGFRPRIPWIDGEVSEDVEADVRAAEYAWGFNFVTREMFVALNGANVESFKSQLKLYVTLSTGLARLTMFNTPVFLKNLYLDGVGMHMDNAAGQTPSIFQAQCWAQDCTIFGGSTVAFNNRGAYTVTDNLRVHASDSDAQLYSLATQGFDPFGIEINPYCTMIGDSDSGRATILNNNGSSSHLGNVARFGGRHFDCLGPCVGDRALADDGVYWDWCVGVAAGRAASRDGVAGNAFLFNITGNANSVRRVWLDRCVAYENPDEDMSVNGNAGANNVCDIRIAECSFPRTVATGSATIRTYSRQNPG